jgi:TonB family protein
MTMEHFFLFIIRASLYLLVFSGGYFLLFRKENRPAFNRFFILGAFAFSLLMAAIPGLTIFGSAEAITATGAIMLPEFVFTAAEGSSRASETLVRQLISLGFLPLLVIILSGLLVLATLVNLLRITWLVRSKPLIRKDGMHVVLLNEQANTFSFFSYVFVPGKIIGHAHFAQVLAHEQAHWRRGHSWDILFMEMMRVLFWFHPSYYFLRKELTAQHEFEADSITCRSVPKTDYQQTLLDYTLSGTLVPLTNPFNISLIKKRIIMMNTRKTHSKLSISLKMLALIPVLLLLVAIQSCTDQTKEPTVEPATEAVVEPAPETPSAYVENVEGGVFNVVHDLPVFPGGEEGRIRFLQENLRYPTSARDAGDQGTVFVSFVIREDGQIANVKVLRGVSTALDEEAVRVVKMMPRWTPGKLDGEDVNTQFNMPIRFVLQKDAEHATIVVE